MLFTVSHVHAIEHLGPVLSFRSASARVEQNQIQINILSSYLPTQLSDEELTAEIQKIISDNKELYDANPKAIIGIAMKSLSSRADPQRIMKALS
jgi:uncharacterized protein YqeY